MFRPRMRWVTTALSSIQAMPKLSSKTPSGITTVPESMTVCRPPEIDFDLWTSIGPITPCRNYGEGWHQTGGNGNTPLYAIANFDPLIPWLHGGDLNVEL